MTRYSKKGNIQEGSKKEDRAWPAGCHASAYSGVQSVEKTSQNVNKRRHPVFHPAGIIGWVWRGEHVHQSGVIGNESIVLKVELDRVAENMRVSGEEHEVLKIRLYTHGVTAN